MATSRHQNVVIDEILLETDMAELVTARDEYGMLYLCCLTSRGGEGDRFLVVTISAAKIVELKAGLTDLRAVMLYPETGGHYNGAFLRVDGRPSIELKALDGPPLEGDLPDEGFYLSDFN